jgi:ABC-2 type transport system ATP-binding protein
MHNSNNYSEDQVLLHNLTFKFGDFIAVDNLNLSIRKNEILGFLGPNGAGKTIVIRMICGLLKPNAGEYEINSLVFELTI